MRGWPGNASPGRSSTIGQRSLLWPADLYFCCRCALHKRDSLKSCGETLRSSVTHTNWFCRVPCNGGRLQVIDGWHVKTELRLKQDGQRATVGAKYCLSALSWGPQVPDWSGIRTGCELKVDQVQTESLQSVWLPVPDWQYSKWLHLVFSVHFLSNY